MALFINFNALAETFSLVTVFMVIFLLSGIFIRFEQWNTVVGILFLAHRAAPQVFVQEIRITNTKNAVFELQLDGAQALDWKASETKILKYVEAFFMVQNLSNPYELQTKKY